MARIFRRTSSLVPQRVSYDDFEPQSEWMEDPMASILKIYLPGFSKDQVTMTPGTSPSTIKVRGIRPLELRNKYRRFEKEFTIPDNTKVDEMSGNFDSESFTITFPKNIIPNNLLDNVPLQTIISDANVDKKLDDDQRNDQDQIVSTTHVMASSSINQNGSKQEAASKVITSVDGERVDGKKELANQIQPDSEPRGHVEDNLAKLLESEGKKEEKDPSFVENVVSTTAEPKPMSSEDAKSPRLKDKETKNEKIKEPSFVENVVSPAMIEQQVPKPKSDEEPRHSSARNLEPRTSTISPPRHRESDMNEKNGKKKVHEPSFIEDVSKMIEQQLRKSEAKGKEGKSDKPSVMESVVSSIIEQHLPKSNGVTQDDARFKEKEHKKEIKEPPVLESVASNIPELELKKHDEPFGGGTSKDVMTMEDFGVAMANAKKTLQLQASKLNEETQITVSIALSLFDIMAAIGAYISHQSNIQRRSQD